MPLAAILEAVHLASAMSENVGFWQSAGKAIDGLDRDGKLSLEDVTLAILQWLRFALVWTSLAERPSMNSKAGEAQEGLPVFVNIYDVSQEDSVHKLNKWLAHKNNPLKFGGVFHAGVEVGGEEWCFGSTKRETLPGVFSVPPRSDPQHHFRQTVYLGKTQMSRERIASTIADLIEDYPGDRKSVV